MNKEKYIGIENELITFEDASTARVVDFEPYFDKLKKGKYFFDSDILCSDTGNHYYVDGDEIEIVTPPIPINRGFASRLTELLVIGRNHVVKNTPELQHTGFSMHWNFTESRNSQQFFEDVAIPFQLFALTPMSCAFNFRTKSSRFEMLGDSLTNEDQIKAAALLFGAYSLASSGNFRGFPLKVSGVYYSGDDKKKDHMLGSGRYTLLTVGPRGPFKLFETQAQNVLELFYEWLSPFVYKLGEQDEIRNLEAFVKGEKKLEIDDIKYFHILQQYHENHLFATGVYPPIDVKTMNGTRSPKIRMRNNTQLPVEGLLLEKLVDKRRFKLYNVEWDDISFDNNFDRLYSIHDIYTFLEQFSIHEYKGTMDLSGIKPENIINSSLSKKLKKRISYSPSNDFSAVINNEEEFTDYLKLNFNSKSLKL